MALSERRSALVPAALDGERIDKAMVALMAPISRRLARKVLAMGGVHVTRQGSKRRRVRRASAPVREGDVLEASWHPDVLEPERFALDIVYEDDDIVVVDKPAGQLSQGSELGDVGSLIHALTRRFGRTIRLMHRLDKGASGVMVAVRNPGASAALTPQFRAHTIRRRYLAVTAGVPPDGVCEVPILSRGRTVRAAGPDEPGARSARSTIAVLARHDTPSGVRAEVAVELHTGRTHQIRIHLEALAAPIVGDVEHGGPAAARLCLHATTLGLTHPRGRPMEFERPPPADFVAAAGCT